MSLCGVVVQARREPSLVLSYAHPLAFVIVGDLIAVDLAEREISRFRMGEVEPTHARSGPHRKRLSNQHSRVRLHIEQTPELALLGVVRTRRVTRGRPDPPILFLDEFLGAQVFFTAVTPLVSRPLVQAFSEGFSQAIG